MSPQLQGAYSGCIARKTKNIDLPQVILLTFPICWEYSCQNHRATPTHGRPSCIIRGSPRGRSQGPPTCLLRPKLCPARFNRSQAPDSVRTAFAFRRSFLPGHQRAKLGIHCKGRVTNQLTDFAMPRDRVHYRDIEQGHKAEKTDHGNTVKNQLGDYS